MRLLPPTTMVGRSERQVLHPPIGRTGQKMAQRRAAERGADCAGFARGVLGVVRIVKALLFSPGKIVSVGGLRAAWSVVLRVTTSPSGGAGWEITTVPVTVLQPATVDCLSAILAQSAVNSATYAIGYRRAFGVLQPKVELKKYLFTQATCCP